MKIRKFAAIAACIGLIFVSDNTFAHGHHDSSHHSYTTGHNSYDCSHYPDHSHVDGVCPYYCTDQSYKYYQASTVKKVQSKLKNLGYSCGSANGIYNSKTKKAIKKFQKNKNMSVNGKITKNLLNKLKL